MNAVIWAYIFLLQVQKFNPLFLYILNFELFHVGYLMRFSQLVDRKPVTTSARSSLHVMSSGLSCRVGGWHIGRSKKKKTFRAIGSDSLPIIKQICSLFCQEAHLDAALQLCFFKSGRNVNNRLGNSFFKDFFTTEPYNLNDQVNTENPPTQK